MMNVYAVKFPKEIKVMSASDGSLHLAVSDTSLQGVFIDKAPEGYEIRINSLSSFGDFSLFRDVLFELSERLEEKIVLDLETPLNNSATIRLFDWDKWIEDEMAMDMEKLEEHLSLYGTPRNYVGVFLPFCIGLRFLHRMKFLEADPVETLTAAQWTYKDTAVTQTGRLMEEHSRIETSLTMFDFDQKIPENGLILTLSESLAIASPKDSIFKITRFRHAQQIFPNAMLFDEEQLVFHNNFNEDEKQEIIKNATIFTELDVFHDPVMPGYGFNPAQRTFILMWNPSVSSVKLEDFIYWIAHIRAEESNWSVYDSDNARKGDRWFLVSCGTEVPGGIVGSGVFDSNPWLGDDWSGKGREVYYCDLMPNMLMNPSSLELVTTAELKYHFPDFEWTQGHSGRILPEEYAKDLEDLWASKVRKWENMPENPDFHLFRS